MKKIFILISVMVLFLSCAPKKEVGEVPTDIYPYDLQVDVDKETMTLAWKTHGTGLKGGYNIYISREPLVEKYPDRNLPASIKPFNPVNYPAIPIPMTG